MEALLQQWTEGPSDQSFNACKYNIYFRMMLWSGKTPRLSDKFYLKVTILQVSNV